MASVPVEVDGTLIYVEVSGDAGGVGTVGADSIFSFDDVAESIQAIAGRLTEVWRQVRPSEASVEFGVRATARSGKLTALIVEGGGEASLKVTLTWRSPTGQPAG